jgi:DNA-binding protein H-NS
MIEWEYRKISLNDTSRQTDDIDLLRAAGEDGWELVVILPNNVAYLKRAFDRAALPEREASEAQQGAAPSATAASTDRSYEVKPKYRDPKTNETWSGRGRMATWLKRKQDAGEDIEKYLA